MSSYPSVVQADDVARRLGLPLPLGADPQWIIEQAITGAQSDLEAYLGQPVVPVTRVDYHRYPTFEGTWDLRWRPVLSITSAVAETAADGTPTGGFTVTYVAGLDAANDPELEPIRRFIKIHAIMSTEVQILFRAMRPDTAKYVTSATAEGQSATWAEAFPNAAAAGLRSAAAVTAQMSMPGAPPTLQTCDRWRIGKRRVYQRPTRPGEAAPWPYDPPQPGTWETWAGRWANWW